MVFGFGVNRVGRTTMFDLTDEDEYGYSHIVMRARLPEIEDYLDRLSLAQVLVRWGPQALAIFACKCPCRGEGEGNDGEEEVYSGGGIFG